MNSFTPSTDTRAIINALLDMFERRDSSSTRTIKVKLNEMNLPAYFSQQDPEPRMIANQQMRSLADSKLIQFKWIAGEENHLLDSVTLAVRPAPAALYTLIQRVPIANQRSQLESLLLADKFRFSSDDWRARALNQILDKLRAGKSPSPFSLSASDFNSDLLAALLALSTLQTETPYRVFSVRVFNDSKRFDELRPALVRLARRANAEWKSLANEDLLCELNLVANPGYIHLSGNWQFTAVDGEVLSLNGFSPSIGFPAAQIASIQSATVHADAVVCIENLTSFHEFIRRASPATPRAVICLMGNPSPATRRLLCLLPETVPTYLWSDLDYGGFNILSQLRRTVNEHIQSYSMDIQTIESNIPRARPLTPTDRANLKRLLLRPELRDVCPVIEHLLERGLKLEQEGVEVL